MSLAAPLTVAHEERLYTRPVRRLFVFTLALLLAVQLALSLYAWSLSERALLPEFGRKAQTTGTALAAQLARALDYGIPLQRLEGVPEFFADVLKQNRDLAYLRIVDGSGKALFGSTQAESSAPEQFLDTALPLMHKGQAVGRLHVGVDKNYIAARVRELRYDIGIVLITSLLIAFEILWFVVTLTFTAPMRQILGLMTSMAAGDFRQRAAPEAGAAIAVRLHTLSARINHGFGELVRSAAALRQTSPQQAAHAEPLLQRLRQAYSFGDAAADPAQAPRIVLVRVLSFLFMFAEMLSRPFLPVYAASLPAGAAAGSLHASLPVTAFLLGVALSMPFAGRWSDRMGRRSSYIAGALAVMAGLAVTGLVPDYYALVVARALTGVGYAIMFMACQGFVFDNTDSSNRGKGMALFVGAIMVAEICAPAVGGILADRVGYRMVFLLGAAVALVAAAIAAAVLSKGVPAGVQQTPARQPQSQPPQASLLARLVRNRRFLALSILSGVPAKFLYSGFLIFLVPVLLSGLGLSKSEIGRYTMLYGLSSLALAPLFAHLADRYNAYAPLVAAGGVLTGLGLLPVAWGASGELVMLGIGALGVGQSMSISAQLVLVARVTAQEAQDAGTGPIVGLFRLLERLGAAAGPVATGALAARYGAAHAMAFLGVFALGASLLFSLVFALASRAAGKPAGPPAEASA
ncbi:MFS transporter [Pseudoduganella aquatica]|uniref:MFS transporter n=1 Tax=Pseudoduganella aquatica TaxID=2660641 RepID=A0A7X4HGI4_9BURK|nr:MFS transporter [Pseudoduganella aquatica]MYN10534.1 MFS transporter [Pseudoduganella aquatica]